MKENKETKKLDKVENDTIVAYPFREKKKAIENACAFENYLYHRPFSRSFKLISYTDIDSGKFSPSCKGKWYWICITMRGGKKAAGKVNVDEIAKETKIIRDAIDVIYRADLASYKMSYKFDLTVNTN